MINLRKSLQFGGSGNPEVPRRVSKVVHWKEEKGPDHLDIKKAIQNKSNLLANLCVFCWLLSLAAFVGGAALRFDSVLNYRTSRPPSAQLDALVFLSPLSYVFGPFAVWGSLQKRHVNVFLFSYLVYITSVVEISVGAVILSFSGKAIREDILPIIKGDPQNQTFIYDIQTKLQCCGALSPYDWVDSQWWQEKRKKHSNKVLPPSCCRLNDRSGKSSKLCNSGIKPYKKVKLEHLIYLKGCQEKISSRLNFFLRLSGGLVFTVGLLKLVSFFAMHLLASQLLKLARMQLECSADVRRQSRRFSRPSLTPEDLDRLHRPSFSGPLV